MKKLPISTILFLIVCFVVCGHLVRLDCDHGLEQNMIPLPVPVVITEDTDGDNVFTAALEAKYGNDVPPLYNNQYSLFVGPWAYIMYAKDENTGWVLHSQYDGYEPKAGDLLITGNDISPEEKQAIKEHKYKKDEEPVSDLMYVPEYALSFFSVVAPFPYGRSGYAWNGHVLYIVDYKDGVATCSEGNTIAPYQVLDDDDPNYHLKSSIDYVDINVFTSETLTEGKLPAKPVRAIIETNFSPGFAYCAKECASQIFEDYQEDRVATRNKVLNTFIAPINWCALYVHYLLLMAQDAYSEIVVLQ